MIDEISKPVVEAAKGTLKCEMDEVKQRGLMTIEKSKLHKPDDTSESFLPISLMLNFADVFITCVF